MASQEFFGCFAKSSDAMAPSPSPSPPSLHPLDFGLDLDSFLLNDHPSPDDDDHLIIPPFSASPPPPPAPNLGRAHPPPRHRRCLFGNSSSAPRIRISAHSASPGKDNGPAERTIPAQGLDAKDPWKKTLQNDSKSKKRGMYNCGKCGQPKRGHVCAGDSPSISSSKPAIAVSTSPQKHMAKRFHQYSEDTSEDHILSTEFIHNSSSSAPVAVADDPSEFMGRCHGSARSVLKKRSINLSSSLSFNSVMAPAASSSATSSCSSNERFKRINSEIVHASPITSVISLSADSSYVPEVCKPQKDEEESMPLSCMVEILSRLHPIDLSAAGSVCRRWRQCAEYAWVSIRQIQLNISLFSTGNDNLDSGGFLSTVLRKCPNLDDLTLIVSSDIQDSLLKCIIALSPRLLSLEICLAPEGVNSITGEGIRNLLRHCKSLTSLKLEKCANMFEVELNSACLETLWLTGCSEIKYMFLNCSRLSELSLDFLPYGNQMSDTKTDTLAAIMKNVGNTAKGLKRLHVASHLLDDRVVHSLLSSGLRSLSMLSLTFGGGITDNSVAAIVANCQRLELLDLSGSSISDKALQMISNSFSSTLTKLLLALCPNISHLGLEMVVSQLPRLQLLDCGKVIVDNWNGVNQPLLHVNDDKDDNMDLHNIHRKTGVCVLQLYHLELEKLSLWGCSGLQELILDCPKLVDLNLTSCSKLKPDGFQLHCPSLKEVHVGKCGKECVDKIQYQMDHALFDPRVIWRRQADGSKRVQAPCIAEEPSICSTP